MADETLDETVSHEEEPVQEAAVESPVDETAPVEPQEASPEQPSRSGRTWAGKYQSPDDLERAYLESQSEASRMAGELAALRRQPQATPQASEPKWKQLESERNKWASYLRNPSISEDQRYQADEQVRLYDREIAYERAKHDVNQQFTRQTAEARMEQDARAVIQQYEPELRNMNSDLYRAAASQFETLRQAGYPENDITRSLAVTYAAALTKTNVSKAVQQDRNVLLKTMNSQMKKAVQAGAGGPAPVKKGGVTAQDIENMSDKEFFEYERRLQGV